MADFAVGARLRTDFRENDRSTAVVTNIIVMSVGDDSTAINANQSFIEFDTSQGTVTITKMQMLLFNIDIRQTIDNIMVCLKGKRARVRQRLCNRNLEIAYRPCAKKNAIVITRCQSTTPSPKTW